MKTVNTIVKILSALAAVAGAVYIIATYGEQITAWAKKALASLPKCPCCKDDAEEDAPPAEAAPEEACYWQYKCFKGKERTVIKYE